MDFFKVDVGVIKQFDTALAGNIRAFSTSTLSIFKTLARHMGYRKTVGAMMTALVIRNADADDWVYGNLARKSHRLPQLFRRGPVLWAYKGIKTFQATLLYQALKLELLATKPKVSIVFNGGIYPETVLNAAAGDLEYTKVYVERGFFPGTLQLDHVGVNGGCSVPRNSEFYLNSKEDFASEGLPKAVQNRPSKVNRGGEVDLKPGYIFVPFQVPSDMQVTRHSPWVHDMGQFLDIVLTAAENNQDEIFVIKEHPSFKLSVKKLRPAHPRVIFANDNVTSELIENARVVLTINSTVGLEGLLLSRPVITLGNACYNVDGLVKHATTPDELDAAIQSTIRWVPPERLRTQFLGYIWNRFLTKATFDNLPDNIEEILLEIAQKGR